MAVNFREELELLGLVDVHRKRMRTCVRNQFYHSDVGSIDRTYMIDALTSMIV